MSENRRRIIEIIEEIREEQERMEERAEVRTGFETATSEPEAAREEEALEARENAERYWRERAEELLDALNPQERRNEASDVATMERAGPHQDGLAVVVGHSRRSLGTSALSPPFPPGLGAEEYHWNSELALQIKALADKKGIRCRIFYRDGFDIPGAYVPVREWAPRATVELHFNAAASPEVQGTETWYGHESSISWAAKLQAKMVKLYGRKGRSDRRTKDARDIDPGTGVPHRAHTSTTQIHPSALIEPFFDKNPDDCRMAVELKPGLARAVIEAYAEFAGVSLAGDGAIVAPIDPAPRPTPITPGSGGQPTGSGSPVSNPSTPLSGVPESDLFASLRQLYLRSETSIAHPDLKVVTLAQWALESSWGTSGLATEHYNFAGMKGISEIGHLSDIATTVNYQAHDGWDRYLRFGSLQNFITGYWRFLERSPYRGWKQHTAAEADFISFIASKWAPHDRQYVTKVIEIAGRLRRALTQGVVGQADGGPSPDMSPGTPRGPAPQLSASAIPADAVEFRKLFDLVTSTALENPALQGTILAQCAIESNWGRSELARAHYNFAGIEWSDVLADFSAPVDYRRGDGTVGKYCRFLDHASFIKGYFARLDRDPRFAGWKAKAGDAKAFIEHIGPIWRPNDANYAKTVLAVLARLTQQAAAAPATPSGPSPSPQPGGVTVLPGQLPDGYVIRVKRRRVEHRAGRGTRTVGDYSAFFRGQKVPGLEGMVFEAHGPGDNTATGTAHHRRLEARIYPLGTHSSAGMFPKYATHGYTGSTIAGAQARPSIRLDNTGYRSGVLFHPGMGFLWSIGCLNFSKPLSGPDKDIDYTDSRARVIAVIEDMKARLGDAFPSRSWKTIPNAWMMIEGEPGQESGREAPSDRFDSIFAAGLTPEQRVDAARREHRDTKRHLGY